MATAAVGTENLSFDSWMLLLTLTLRQWPQRRQLPQPAKRRASKLTLLTRGYPTSNSSSSSSNRIPREK
ncbi:hypothetical protein TYRP_008710 [Tyrophagus putrescentiae]|nr:hypothetical protein TYRP_008710 [Tyrophagus putrescentiae]